MRNWSKCWRHVANNMLSGLLARTNWHAWMIAKDDGVAGRTLKFRRDGHVDQMRVSGGELEWTTLSTRRCTLWWSVEDGVEDTLNFHIAIPYVFSLYVCLDLVRVPNWIKRRTGEEGSAQYGFWLDRKEGGVYWRYSVIKDCDGQFPGWVKEWKWKDLHGEPVVITTSDTAIEAVYIQTASHGFAASNHEIRVIQRKTVKRWPRFWKRDEVHEGYEVSLDNPPPVTPGSSAGIYGTFIKGAATPYEAIMAYSQKVKGMRETFQQSPLITPLAVVL